MRLHKALVVGDEAKVTEYAKLLVAERFTVEPAGKGSWTSQLEGASAAKVDVVVVDIEMPKSPLIKSLKKAVTEGKLPVVMITEDYETLGSTMKELSPLMVERNFDVLRKPVDPAEFRLRIKGVAQQARSWMNEWCMPELRSDKSGRLSAIMVGKYFGWSLKSLSASLGCSVQSVHKTPDSPRLQAGLEKWERAALLARRCMGPNETMLRKWLNAPARDLDGERPGELLLKKADVVVQWLEDMALGQPG